MKSKILFGGSLFLNALLAIWLWKGSAKVGVESPGTMYVTNREPVLVAKVVTNASIAQPAKPVRVLDWRAVESGDYQEYIANLRTVGCPEETIRDIIIADVNKLYKERLMEGASTNKYEYWKGGNLFAGLFDETRLEKQQQLTQEKRALLKELLGSDVSLPMDVFSGVNPLDQMLDFIPEKTRNDLMNVEQRYAAKLGKVMKDAAAGDMSSMKAVMAEKDAELLEMLGPEQKLEYDLRMSQSSMLLRMQMGDFEPTEQEFREMFKARKAFDDEYGLAGAAARDPKNAEQRQTAERDLNEQMKNTLGQDRYTQYRHEQDWMRSSLRQVAQDFNIPKTDAVRVFDLKYAAEEEAARVRNNAEFNSEQQRELLGKIRQETENAVAQVLGADAAKAYVDRGSWIKQLNPAPPAPVPAEAGR